MAVDRKGSGCFPLITGSSCVGGYGLKGRRCDWTVRRWGWSGRLKHWRVSCVAVGHKGYLTKEDGEMRPEVSGISRAVLACMLSIKATPVSSASQEFIGARSGHAEPIGAPYRFDWLSG